MKRFFAITAMLTGLWCGTANAQWVSVDVSPYSTGPISVKLQDAAEDACWTNLREVREYADEKLQMSGYGTRKYEVPTDLYTIYITVIARRTNGQCVGSILLELQKSAIAGGIFGYHQVGSSFTALGDTNFNNPVIDQVRKFINKM